MTDLADSKSFSIKQPFGGKLFYHIMKPAILLFSLFAFTKVFAADHPKIDARTAGILTELIRDVLFNAENKSAREFYGTPEDKTVILLDGSLMTGKATKWPAGFIPKIEGFTFVFGYEKDLLPEEQRNRRLAIRLDRFVVDPAEEPEGKHPLLTAHPIRISIQNGGGEKNGAVMGGRTAFYSLVKKGKAWGVKFEGAFS